MAAPSPAMASMRYTFRPATCDDLAMLRDWLATPEVVRWWGEPNEQYALFEEDLRNPLMVMRIVAYDGRPFAYVQDYDVHTWPQPHFSDLPQKARGIDAFIGVPHMIGQGHGAAFLRERAMDLISAGAPLVAIDPDASNLRARRAYARAGFVETRLAPTPAGDVAVMVFAGGANPARWRRYRRA